MFNVFEGALSVLGKVLKSRQCLGGLEVLCTALTLKWIGLV